MGERKRKRKVRRTSKAVKVGYCLVGFFALGYFPTLYLGDFRISMVSAVLAVIPFGIKTTSLRTGAIRGASLGTVAGVAMIVGLVHFQVKRDSIVPGSLALLCLAATAIMCAVVCTLFAHFSRKRQERLDQQWR